MIQISAQWYRENVSMFRSLFGEAKANWTVGNSDVKFDYRRGDFVYRTGDLAQEIFLLEAGRVKIGSYSENGKEIIKSILKPGDIFGEQVVTGAENRHNFAQVLDDEVSVFPIQHEHFRQLMGQNHDFAYRITRLLGLRLQQIECRLESLVFMDARSRIVHFLREVALEEGVQVGEELLVKNFLTHKEIASLTSTSRQTVTSVLNELREENQIYFDRKRLLIRDIGTLK